MEGRPVSNMFAVLCVLLTSGAMGADPVQVEIWPPGPVPGENGLVIGPEYTQVRQYVNITDRILYNVSRPTLWPYLVSNGTGSAIVIAPGGVSFSVLLRRFDSSAVM